MNSKLAKRLFKKADELYRGKNYAAALEELDRLDKAFPDTRRILYPRAMCLAEVGRIDEAVAICDRLISRHKYKRAVDLKSQVQKYQRVLPKWNAGVPAIAPSNLESMNIEYTPGKAFAPVLRPPVPMWRTTSARVIAGVVLFVAVVSVGAYFASSRDAGVVNAAPPASLAAPSELSIPDAALDDLPQDDATAQEAVGETAAGLDTTTATMAGPEPN